MGRTFRQRKRKKDAFTTDNENDKYIALLSWMVKAGYKPKQKLQPKVFPGTGRGLMTKCSIKPNGIILSVPSSLLISPSLVLRSDLGCYIKRYCEHPTGTEILAAFLMWEKSKGRNSFWYPYIATLPVSYTTPGFIPDGYLPVLPPSICRSVAEQIRNLQRSYVKMKDLFVHLKTVNPLCKNIFCFETYCWAFYSVNTRCVYKYCEEPQCLKESCTNDLVLVPFLDFLNHDCRVQVAVKYCSIRKCLEIRTLTHVKKFEQVFINYGPHNNRRLFLEYGFVLCHNPHDAIPIMLDEVLSSYTEMSGKVLSPEALQFYQNEKLFRNLSLSIDGPCWALERLLQLLCGEEDFRKSVDVYNVSPLDEAYLEKIKEHLHVIVNLKMKEYDCAITSLSRIPGEKSKSEMFDIILSLLEIEKNVLYKAIS